ncbi:MAG: hypothetical protein ACI31A_06540 [Candidatus Limisoma sp.]
MNVYKIIIAVLLAVITVGCSTGVESIGRITERDVARYGEKPSAVKDEILEIAQAESVERWRPGKRFMVTDDRFRVVLDAATDSATQHLGGKMLTYKGYRYARHIDNQESIVLEFVMDSTIYRYDTGKELEALKSLPTERVMPYVIDMDRIAAVDSALRNKTCYIRTRNWLSVDRKPIGGLKFVAVDIRSVEPGDDVYPMFVKFDYEGKTYGVRMSWNESAVASATFGRLFSSSDMRRRYKHITDAVWEQITCGSVSLGMTKEECSLSMGSPEQIDRATNHAGLYERWSYSNGAYLIFENGILQRYRR